jgi:hypothetical protein
MRLDGEPLVGLEYGNAWDLRDPDQFHTNWIIGCSASIPLNSLRYMSQTCSDPHGSAEQVCVKWFQHHPNDPSDWGKNKPISTGRTLSLLVSTGRFRYCFRSGSCNVAVELDRPGDFVIWGEGLEHQWCALDPVTIVTVRWVPALPFLPPCD